jgi:two-component system response regulator PilR (NtrC family)
MKKIGRILVVDDEESMRRFFFLTLEREGFQVDLAEGVTAAKEKLRTETFDLVLSDIRLGDGQGLEVLATAKAKDPDLPVIVMTAYASAETAVEAMKLGASDYLAKPFNVDEVRIVVKNTIRTRNLVQENRSLRAQLKGKTEQRFIFVSRRMDQLFSTLDRIARMDVTVLITGESGTGKELVMRMIHEKSPRAQEPFVSVNCGALPESLFESELFGFEKGAFTGADQRRKGLFETAGKGTLFLDEIGEMPLTVQVKLLRVLQEKMVRRVGGNEELPVDVRVVAATNRNLSEEVKAGRFREDLFYRINVVPIEIPPLRQRPEDIAPLIRFFLEKYCDRFGEPLKSFDRQAMAQLEGYTWPGNVRELENTIERIVALNQETNLGLPHLPPNIAACESAGRPSSSIHIPSAGFQLESYLEELRMAYMQEAMRKTAGVQTNAAELLGMTFRSFRYYYGKLSQDGCEVTRPVEIGEG